PWHGPDTIETQQAELRAEPQVSIRRLRDGRDEALREALADPPRRVHVLARVESRIQRERRRTRGQQHHGERRRARRAAAAARSAPNPHDDTLTNNERRRPRTWPVAYAAAAGIFRSISVPIPISLHTSSRPPMTSARSRMPDRPKCPGRCSASIV